MTKRQKLTKHPLSSSADSAGAPSSPSAGRSRSLSATRSGRKPGHGATWQPTAVKHHAQSSAPSTVLIEKAATRSRFVKEGCKPYVSDASYAATERPCTTRLGRLMTSRSACRAHDRRHVVDRADRRAGRPAARGQRGRRPGHLGARWQGHLSTGAGQLGPADPAYYDFVSTYRSACAARENLGPQLRGRDRLDDGPRVDPASVTASLVGFRSKVRATRRES
jgi:hypothetical protein